MKKPFPYLKRCPFLDQIPLARGENSLQEITDVFYSVMNWLFLQCLIVVHILRNAVGDGIALFFMPVPNPMVRLAVGR